MIYRPYEAERDEKDVVRIWQECGWFSREVRKDELEAFRRFAGCGTADVAELDGAAECLVLTAPGTIRMVCTEIPFLAVTTVTVGRRLRKQGAAGRLTARALARAAENGGVVAGLGIFDQGFYDKLGFGNFPYIRTVSFDPATLRVPRLTRPPVRLGLEDVPRMAANIQERRPCHGMVRLPCTGFYELGAREEADCFGLGFEDEKGRITHHFWAKPKDESGPYEIWWTAYRNLDELIELLSAMKSLEDQVYSMSMQEPQGIRIQDLLERPLRNRAITDGGTHKNWMRAASWKQARILDLEKTLAPLTLAAGSVRFALDLVDPLEIYLPDDGSWRGIGGRWIITLEETGSRAERGDASVDLPVMRASVNAFTRLVFGVVPASGLAATDDLDAPAPLLESLDRLLLLPEPDMVQEF